MKREAIYMSPRWGLDVCGIDIAIHMSPRWGFFNSLVHGVREPDTLGLTQLVHKSPDKGDLGG